MRNAIASLVCLLCCAPVFAGDLNVSGTGSINATPDMATLSFAVVTDGKDAREASQANAKLMDLVMDATKKLELPAKDISTSNYNIAPVYESRDTLKGSRSVIVGYRATNQVSVRICDIDKVGAVIDGLLKAGVNRTGNLQFGFSNLEELQDKARTLAVTDARRKADIYAKALGVAVSSVPKTFSEQVNYGYGRMYTQSLRMADTIETPISAGEETVSVTVRVIWEMQAK